MSCKIHKFLFLFSLLAFLSCFAQDKIEENSDPKQVEKIEQGEPKDLTSKELREKLNYSALVTYSLIDLWIPSKYGFTLSYNYDSSKTFELDYIRGSVGLPVVVEDIGSISEQRLSLLFRNFSDRNSLNFHYGINYYSFLTRLGNTYLDTISSRAPGVDLIKIKTIGLNWGFGNRWQYNNIVFGVDWLALDIPIIKLENKEGFTSGTSSAKQKEDVNDIMDTIGKIPRFAAFKLQLGVSF